MEKYNIEQDSNSSESFLSDKDYNKSDFNDDQTFLE